MQLMPLVKPKSQGQEPTCVPIAGALWMEYLLMRAGVYVDLAWRAAYEANKLATGGTDFMGYLQHLIAVGLPDLGGRFYRLRGWTTVPPDQYRATAEAGVPMLCLTRFAEYSTFPPPYNRFQIPLPPRYGDTHAGVIVGYNDYGPIVQQSNLWWGDNGLINLPKDYYMMMAVTGELMPVEPDAGREVRMLIGNREIRINGKALVVDVPAQIVGGRTMVPLRLVAEALGADVAWDEAAKTVRVTQTR